MSIPVNATCYLCHFNKHVETALSLGDEATATAFAKDLMQIYLNAAEGTSSPVFTPLVSELYQKYYDLDPDRFKEEKEASTFSLWRGSETSLPGWKPHPTGCMRACSSRC